MKGITLWALGASVAFLVAGNTFLLLANLGSEPATSNPIPRAEPPDSEPARSDLVLKLPEDRLEGLRKAPGQWLALDVENAGSEELTNVNIMLDVASEDTTRPRARYYQETGNLAPEETTTVEFEIDLTPPVTDEGRETYPAEGQARGVLEIRATTPDGASAVKTAILAP